MAKDARKGKHANLFCQVIITKDGHPIPHNVGQGGTLRIDPPPPAPKKKPEAKETPVKTEQKEARNYCGSNRTNTNFETQHQIG